MLFKKVFIYFVSTILTVTVLIGLVIFYFLGSYVIDQKEAMLVSTGERISSFSEEMLKTNRGSFDSYFKLFGDISSTNLDSDVLLVDIDGTVVFGTGNKYKNSSVSIPSDMLSEVNDGKNSTRVTENKKNMPSTLMVGVPLRLDRNIIGGIYLLTFLPEITRLREDVIRIYLFSGLAVILLSLILIYVITKRVTDPIKAIRKASKDLSTGKFQTRVKVFNKEDEIGQLAEEFNDMADSIEKSEYMRRTFISDVSHELRTPLTTITGFVQGILDDTIPKEKQEFYLNVVLDESRRLSKLIGDLLDVSRMESEEVKIEPVRFNINELIRLSIIGFEERFNEKNLTVNAIFKNEIEEVFADKDSIKRVVTNLLDNAIKFSNHKGVIDISTYQKGNKVIVSIKNEGEGISKDEQKTIFERFYKLDKSRSQNKNGVGLGLYIVKRIINKHGEKIWINSEEGKYAEFVFSLKK